jgi:hypothetical protein
MGRLSNQIESFEREQEKSTTPLFAACGMKNLQTGSCAFSTKVSFHHFHESVLTVNSLGHSFK